MKSSERRGQARIEVQHPIKFFSQDKTWTGELLDFSVSGARLRLPVMEEHFLKDASINIEVENLVSIDVELSLVHVLSREDEYTTAGFQFKLSNPKLRDRLFHLLEQFIRQPGGGKRKHPRVSKRIELGSTHSKALVAILENISMGGLSLTCLEDYELHQPIELVIPYADGKSLDVSGTVVHKEEIFEEENSHFRLGIQFKKLNPEVEAQILKVIESITEIDLPAHPPI